MLVNNTYYRTIWVKPGNDYIIQAIDQRKLPFVFEIIDLCSPDDMFLAIKDMAVRGAPLIGIAGAFGLYLALMDTQLTDNNWKDEILEKADFLKSARPTAINLSFAIDEVVTALKNQQYLDPARKLALEKCLALMDDEVENCKNIGRHGYPLIDEISKKNQGGTVNILTHCNAGWLACIDYGTATAPIYMAHDAGIKVHVWVDETRPRNQGARLTAWELAQHGVPNTVIADNTGGYLMQQGLVDLVIVGSDRTTVNGDVANKIGTYLKALAAFDNQVPFYVALPSSSIDWNLEAGEANIPIELRDENELTFIEGIDENNQVQNIRIVPEGFQVSNVAFDVTPSRLVTGLITEKGICKAGKNSILKLFNKD